MNPNTIVVLETGDYLAFTWHFRAHLESSENLSIHERFETNIMIQAGQVRLTEACAPGRKTRGNAKSVPKRQPNRQGNANPSPATARLTTHGTSRCWRVSERFPTVAKPGSRLAIAKGRAQAHGPLVGRLLMTGRVVWVADGDTVHVRFGSRLERVRYIGVNAPEIPHHQARGWREGGAQALAANRQLVARRAATLELDIARRDSYGRLLAYVWVQGGQTRVMANAEMIRQGFAQVMTVPPNVRYQALFLALQREARHAGRGLWGGA